MECPSINNLELDQSDQNALESIRKVRRNEELLSIALPTGVMATIFLGNKPLQAGYNIHSTDWELFAGAVHTLPKLTRSHIVKVAQMQQLRLKISYKQKQFWRAVERGCTLRETAQ